ncbi:LAME_0E12926g1_1 [Lachancea meyersii CBS 8951]|uniref:LAME_0E12926g1_1 n=1 Tax=Lachancea meyersii CBS 8951 TaxID=1266667 RepID=A0A1G4JLZ9_9SACH|nr:LAME_0E12926g1_1 [Lachancea meyersii CBS 8951]
MGSNKKDTDRDVFGRDLSYLVACHPALEQLNKIDLYSHDMESGYTPLHICLREGYLRKAFKLHQLWKKQHHLHYKPGLENVWDLTDREGLTPIELYRCENDIWNYHKIPGAISPVAQPANLDRGLSFIVQWEPRSQNGKSSRYRGRSVKELRDVYCHLRGGRELYTTGTNTNLQLGTGDSEDRKELFKFNEYLVIDFATPCLRPRFKLVIMKRYHSIIVTTAGDCLIAGTGSRGRLGNGSIKISNVSHSKINLENHRVSQLDSSDHHSIALTTNGEVFTWGWNRYSQLGYSTTSVSGKKLEKSAQENICSPNPKKLTNPPWKKGSSAQPTFVACSKVHTCLIDDQNNLYVWGLNLGQMGTTKSYTEDNGINYCGYQGWIVSTPLRIKLPQFVNKIKQLFCTDFATFILWGENQLCVLNNYKTLNFSVPKMTSKQASSNEFDVFTPNSLSKKNTVIKLKTTHPNGNNLCVLYDSGSVGILSSELLQNAAHGWSKLPNLLPISIYWTPYYGWNKCIDFDVAANGQLVLCTTGGHIYRSNSATNPKFECLKSKNLTSGKIISVSCDSFFSSFGLIKDDVDMIPLSYIEQNVYSNMASISPFATAHRSRRALQNYELQDNQTTPCHFDEFVKCFKDECEELSFLPERLDGIKLESSKTDMLWSLFVERWGNRKFSSRTDQFQKSLKDEGLAFSRDLADCMNFDTVFVEKDTGAIIGACHRSLLEARATLFVTKLVTFGSLTSNNETGASFRLVDDFTAAEGQVQIETDLGQYAPKALSYALQYLYTDDLPDTSFIVDPQERRHLDTSIKGLMKVLDLHLTAFRGDQLPFALTKLLDHCVNNSASSPVFQPDVRFMLANNEVLEAYSFILMGRSAYFEALLSDDWGRTCGNLKEIHMHNVSIYEMTCVLKYVHALSYAELFSHCSFADYKSFINFVLGLIQLAAELMMTDFKSYLESTLVDFIDASTVLIILVNAHRLMSKSLVIECCWFIHNNIELLFTERNSPFIEEFFDSALWVILQDFVADTRKMNRERFEAWYIDEAEASSLLRLFQENFEKYNGHFMDPNNCFKPSFEVRNHAKKLTGPKKGADRRKSSVNRKNSLAQEDLVNVRRPSSSSLEIKRPSFSGFDFCQGEANDVAIDDENENTGDQGFVTVSKNKRKPSKGPKDATFPVGGLRGSSSGLVASDSNTNVVRFETHAKFEGIAEAGVQLAAQGLPTDRRSLFPELGNSLQGNMSSDSATRSNGAAFSSVKKLSQKERIKLAARDVAQDSKPRTKPVWGSNTAKPPVQPTVTAASKFPSLAQSLKDQGSRKKAQAIGLTSTGESSTIPLYLSNTNNLVAQPSRSLKDAIEEERFAKWWAAESERVQQQLKADRGNEAGNSQTTKTSDQGHRNGGKKNHTKPNRTRRNFQKRQIDTKASM